MMRPLLALALLAGFLAPIHAAAPPAGPLPAQIARWIEQLGDEDFETRVEAEKKLRAAGERAEAALTKAAESPDAEVKRRARSIVADFKIGIYPDTPEKVVELIRSYQIVSSKEKLPVIQKLIAAGPYGSRALIKLARNETDALVRKDVFTAVGQTVMPSAGRLLEDNNRLGLESLLELAVEGDLKTGAPHFAAYHLLNGTLRQKIAEYEKRAKERPPGKAEQEVLVYLYRATGDAARARKAAVEAERNDLLEGLLFAQSDWKELDRRTDFSTHPQLVVTKGYRAAYARLAGNTKAYEKYIAEIVEQARPVAKAKGDVLTFAKVLFFNHKPAEAIELLQSAENSAQLLMDVFVAQLRFKEAFHLADEAERNNRPERWTLQLSKARSLHALGKKDEALAIVKRAAAEIKPGASSQLLADLVETEKAMDRRDEAFGHVAQWIAVHKDEGALPAAFRELFRDMGDETWAVWSVLKGMEARGTPQAKLVFLRAMFDGKATAAQLRDFIKDLGAKPPPEGTAAQKLWRAVGEACVLCRQDKLAVECFAQAGIRGMVRVGDLMLARKQARRALEAYDGAYRKAIDQATLPDEENDGDALPSMALYLSGKVMVDMGRAAEGKARMARAHLLLLGDCERRFAWARALRRRDLDAAYRREGELMAMLGEPVPTEDGSYYTVEGTRILATRAEKKGEYLKAADEFEQVFLGCMQPQVNFTRAAAYVSVPSHMSKLRAVGLAKAGKFDESRREASAALAGWPGNLDVAIGLVPVLEKAGRKKDADAVYRTALGAQEALLKAHPDSPLIHNQLAWLAACCKRDLKKAHEWAKKAVAAAPKTPAYVDTLAEVLFQLGKKDDAIAAQKTAIALDPKRKYFKLQLKRIEAGDPKAPLPYEDDEDDE